VLEAINAGVNNYIVKPFTTETLRAKLQKVLG
jgi:YesN/AraC family two-component response regulator